MHKTKLGKNLFFTSFAFWILAIASLTSCSLIEKVSKGGVGSLNFSSSSYVPGNNSVLSPTHKKVVKSVVTQPAQKGTSWEGKWMFTLVAQDGHEMKEYTAIEKNVLDEKGKLVKSENVEVVEPEQFLHAGFIVLENSPNGPIGYDLTGYGKVKISHYNMKVSGNNLEWNFAWIPTPEDKGFYGDILRQGYFRQATYDPETDVLYGTCSMSLVRKYKRKGKEKEVVIPIGQYVWKASRLSDEDFKNIAMKGERHPGLPREEFIVYVDKKHPTVEKIVDIQFDDGFDELVEKKRKELGK